ncbi:g4478 [Coccomyxa viridis]|uniref:G4478 protein n=1 Tax=Coccomyxa viridis TaxID=1274662 RepID=A0ABP1FQD3_9CHLO
MAPLKGEWVKHPDHNYQGMTDPKTCPDFVRDYDCRSSDIDTKYHSLQQKEFRKVFRPYACDLHAMNATYFAQCLKGQRMIIVGDSTMRQVFQSLACLLHEEIVEGYLVPWEEAKPNQTSVPFEKQYFIRDTEATILKQNVGMFKLRNGVEVHFQSFGSFNMSLWDDMMEKFKPLSKKDILFLEFGAWYPRFAVWDMHTPWERYQKDVFELLDQRLRRCGANVLWRAYGPTHFGTDLGAFTGISWDLKDMPKQEVCEPAKHGEYYYDTEIMKYLKKCGEFCAHIHILPVYHLSLPAHNSHHGSFGRGISEGAIDCRHYCANVVDTWNQVLYNKLCFLPLGKGVRSRQLKP